MELNQEDKDKVPRASTSSGNAGSEDPLLEIKVYFEDNIIDDTNPAYSLFLLIRENVLELPNVSVSVLKLGIRLDINGKRFGEISSRGVSKTKFDVLTANGDKIRIPQASSSTYRNTNGAT